jgi:glyoxylase-like metal-dependent hydrolase (beta-lactamase superfamily II)
MALRIHHLNCCTMCPVLGGTFLPATHMICHCFLIETGAGLVLVDTGLGSVDVDRPGHTLTASFRHVLRPALRHDETAIHQVRALGFQPEDVRHIVVTHLDLDHAGGLVDFPAAQVHLLHDEKEAALSPRTFRERDRYRQVHWAHGPRWETYNVEGEPWRGVPCVRSLRGLPPEILLVPMAGHTRGHTAVVVELPERTLVHCGDGYFFHTEMDAISPRCPPALAAF